MTLPTWGELQANHCTSKWSAFGGEQSRNPMFEHMAVRRYNYSSSGDLSACRLVFLRGVLDNSANNTLVRNGRFIWCRNLKYEGRDEAGLRQVSFTVDKGKKRFLVSENNFLCVPSKSFVNNNRWFRQKEKTFTPFSSVFSYENTIDMMLKQSDLGREEFIKRIQKENPYVPGTLVAPRLGYFYPSENLYTNEGKKIDSEQEHPYGIIIGSAFENNDYAGREFYRVKFAATTYERVHPVQMEIVNEV